MALPAPQHVHTDVLVIGAGFAGCRAAIAAAEAGIQDVLILAKGPFTTSGSSFYPLVHGVGMSASTPNCVPEDSPDVHFADILAAGGDTVDHCLARVLVDEAPDRLDDLIRFGIPLPNYQSGTRRYSKGLCFNTYPRGDCPRMEHLREAFPRILDRLGVEVRDGVMVTALLGGPDGCRGALAMTRDGQPIVIHAGTTILATGGASPVFRRYSDTPELTGDGYALALRMGAALTNIEFFQIWWNIVHPAGGILPDEVSLYNNPAMMGKTPRLVNAQGKEFLSDYLPDDVSIQECIETRVWHGPFSTRLPSKWFDISFFSEVQAGRGTEHDGVWVDFRGLVPEPIHKSDHYIIANRYRRKVIDVWREMVEMTLFVFAFNGGIRIRPDASTSAPGLYACGEVSGGMHSADRLGGNAFASTQVFGRRAGVSAAAYVADHAQREPDAGQVQSELRHVANRLAMGTQSSLAEARGKIRETMWRHAMICKSEEGLDRCLEDLDAIYEHDLPAAGPTRRDELFHALDLENLWQTAHIIASVSRERRESRGPHYRIDYPDPDARFAGSFLVEPRRATAHDRRLDYSIRLVNLTEE